MLSARLILGATAGLGLLLVLPVLPPPIRPALGLAALAMPVCAARFLDALFQVHGRPSWSAWPSLVSAGVLVPGTGLALATTTDATLPSLVAVAAGIAHGAVALALAARLAPLRPARWRTGLATVRAAAGLGVSNALGALNARAGLVTVAMLAGAAEAGRFSAGFRFFEFGAALAVTLAAPLVPVLGRAAGSGPRRDVRPLLGEVRRALGLVLAAGGPGAVVACVLAGPVIGLLFGPDFAASVPILRIAVAMSLLMLAATVLFAGLVALGRTGFAMVASGAALLVNLAGCALLVPGHGALGAGIAALAAEGAMLLVVGACFWRAAGAPLATAEAAGALGPGLLTGAAALACPPALAPYAVPAVALAAAGGGLRLLAGPALAALPTPDAAP